MNRPLRRALVLAGVAAVYFAAARFGLSLALVARQVTAVWPPTGLALAAAVFFGPRVWPGLFAGAFAINAALGEPLHVAAALGAGNTAEALAGAWLLRRFAFDAGLGRVQSAALLVLAAIGSTLVSASVGVVSLCAAGLVPWQKLSSVFSVWWLGDGLGDLVVAPVLLTLGARPLRALRKPLRKPTAELCALFAATLLAGYLVFAGPLSAPASPFQLQYLVFPFLIWAALRFDQRASALLVLAVSALAIWGALHDRGPFAAGALNERLIALQAFMGVAAITGLALSSGTAERRDSQAALLRARDELEERVRARTAELSTANRELADKNEEVEAFVYAVSHDLRAPLTNLTGFARELALSCGDLEGHLRGQPLPPHVEEPVAAILQKDLPEALRFIAASTAKFQRLIDSLLLLSRLGRQEYRAEELDVALLVGGTVDTLRHSLETGNVQVQIAPLPPAFADPTAVSQVFGNLLSNAIKYQRPGRAGTIEVGGDRLAGMCHYWVKDDGAGIPASAQPRLFQVMQRFHPHLASGEGMGLTIVRRVVERHGGKVWVESLEGVGSTFHLTLPAARSAA